MLYPEGGSQPQENPNAGKLKGSHYNFAPGEQKKRDYDWKINPRDHVFGYAEKKVLNGAALAL
jgi:hypothetical protein